jgi:hypothetical protein
MSELMKKTWKVLQNTGKRADLSNGSETREVPKPKSMSTAQFHDWLRPESEIDDAALAMLKG